MNLHINGEPRQVRAGNLADLVAELELQERPVATALNGEFVPKGQRAARILQAGDAVEIVSPMQGG